MLVFGGTDSEHPPEITEPLNDGASYDPATGIWREIPPAPFTAPPFLPQAVWTGAELVVLAIPCTDTGPAPGDREPETYDEPRCEPGGVEGAAFSPSNSAWRTIELPVDLDGPQRQNLYSSVGWSGSEAVFLLGDGYWGFNPQSSSWRPIPEPPFPPRRLCVAPTGAITAIEYFDEVRPVDVVPDDRPGGTALPDRTSLRSSTRAPYSVPVSVSGLRSSLRRWATVRPS